MPDSLLGAFLSLVAAYGFCVVTGVLTTTRDGRWGTASLTDLFFGGPLFALAFTFWLVIPVGVLIGSLIPRLVKNRSAARAIVYGIMVGVIIGFGFAAVGAYIIANAQTISSDPIPDTSQWWPIYWNEFWSLGSVTTVYSSLWVAAYAFFRSARHQPTVRAST